MKITKEQIIKIIREHLLDFSCDDCTEEKDEWHCRRNKTCLFEPNEKFIEELNKELSELEDK